MLLDLDGLAVTSVAASVWTPAVNADGQIRDEAWVAERGGLALSAQRQAGKHER
ncbi:hypothetical protein GCM10012280_49100 [Wenjunlia tyrosinilytica]|uniref:Uncharacterized protein n=1 Tax=Wenjunlia tyrosinilytica TaxID=1544741 RepID=A0A917ZWR8_9ACTN|nr:hypothetical protein GCM10012280_49100 [Wenjunlia tyrosinilytica]